MSHYNNLKATSFALKPLKTIDTNNINKINIPTERKTFFPLQPFSTFSSPPCTEKLPFMLPQLPSLVLHCLTRQQATLRLLSGSLTDLGIGEDMLILPRIYLDLGYLNVSDQVICTCTVRITGWHLSSVQMPI